MSTRKGRCARVKVTAFLGAVAISLVACSSSSPKEAAATLARGGTATLAEGALTPPTFIFPFVSLTDSGINNTTWFQYLMYRPLYYFGVGATPDLNTSLSLAASPTYSSDRTSAVVSLKHYRWSDGEHVSSDDVMFWMNMLHAAKVNFADYVPGTFPDNVRSVRIVSPTLLTFTFTRPVNPLWMTYNQLSQITPMPKAWDVTATGAPPGSGGCFGKAYGSADSACRAVFDYLSTESGLDPGSPDSPAAPPTSFASNPLWQVVDGPWRLASLDGNGNVTMVPNRSYSGPVKPRLARFKEVAFTSDDSEYTALLAGQVDVGYLPLADAPPTTRALQPSRNASRLSAYQLVPVAPWGVAYMSYNFNSTGDGGLAGRIFSQLYVRQSVQELVDQRLYDRKIFKGFALPTYSPVPSLGGARSAIAVDQSNPYPYDVARARATLSDHGWTVDPGGTSTCLRPGSAASECGAGIPADAPLRFTLEYAVGDPTWKALMNVESSSWEQGGIHVDLQPESNQAIGTNVVPCAAGPSCTWQLGQGGWLYSPDYYPTGEDLFATGANSNAGNYSDTINDANIRATYEGSASLTGYADYLAHQLPVIWEPGVTYLSEVRRSLHGAVSHSVLVTLTPENWQFATTR
jgi:peptide/nickel transport system substrate-binding protein